MEAISKRDEVGADRSASAASNAPSLPSSVVGENVLSLLNVDADVIEQGEALSVSVLYSEKRLPLGWRKESGE